MADVPNFNITLDSFNGASSVFMSDSMRGIWNTLCAVRYVSSGSSLLAEWHVGLSG
jgi:hypothetical protein